MENEARPWESERRAVEYPKSSRSGASASMRRTAPCWCIASMRPRRAERSRMISPVNSSGVSTSRRHDRLEQDQPGHPGGLAKSAGGGDLEAHDERVVRTEEHPGDHDLEVGHRVAREHAGAEAVADTLGDRRD